MTVECPSNSVKPFLGFSHLSLPFVCNFLLCIFHKLRELVYVGFLIGISAADVPSMLLVIEFFRDLLP